MTEPVPSDVLSDVLAPAPGADRYVGLDLANSTVALAGGQHVDALATPASANQWLTAHGLAPPDAGLRDYCGSQLRALREQVRTLLAARTDGLPAPETALRAINDAMTRAPTATLLRWTADREFFRETSHPTTQVVDHALATLAADVADLLTGEDADRIAACGSPPCTRYLIRTHARRQWCSVRCGDRARAARAYARRTRGD